MRSTLFLLSLTALLAASCNEISIPDYQSMSLDINVTTAAETKALFTGTTLTGSVGLFLTDESGVTYDGLAVSNVKYTSTGNGSMTKWVPVSDKVMLSPTKGTLKAYYPYSNGITDITAIPVTETSTKQTDWMWATPVANLNSKNYSALVTMNHALAAVRLSLIRGSYNGVGDVTSVSFSSDGAATDAVLDATDGSLSSVNGAGTEFVSSESFSLGTTKKSIDFIVVPTGTSAPISIEVTVNGSAMVAETEAVTLQAGKVYEYTLAIGTEGVYLNKMNATDWSVIDNGTVELQPK